MITLDSRWRDPVDGRWTIAVAVCLTALLAWTRLPMRASASGNGVDAINPSSVRTLVMEPHDEWTGDPPPVPAAPRVKTPTIAVRNHNPLNIKYGGATLKYVTQGIASISRLLPRDGGRFLKFQSPAAGFRAAVELLMSPLYTSLDLDGALRRWSNNGYGAEIVAAASIDPSSTIATLEHERLAELLRAMATAEGYRSAALSEEVARAIDDTERSGEARPTPKQRR